MALETFDPDNHPLAADTTLDESKQQELFEQSFFSVDFKTKKTHYWSYLICRRLVSIRISATRDFTAKIFSQGNGLRVDGNKKT